MNKKTIIQMMVIIVALGITGWVLYSNFFASKSSSPANPLAPATASQPDISSTLLSNGDKLDFSVLDRRNFKFGQVSYPTSSLNDLNPARPLDDLIKLVGQ